jgi:hypothetical protein
MVAEVYFPSTPVATHATFVLLASALSAAFAPH